MPGRGEGRQCLCEAKLRGLTLGPRANRDCLPKYLLISTCSHFSPQVPVPASVCAAYTDGVPPVLLPQGNCKHNVTASRRCTFYPQVQHPPPLPPAPLTSSHLTSPPSPPLQGVRRREHARRLQERAMRAEQVRGGEGAGGQDLGMQKEQV